MKTIIRTLAISAMLAASVAAAASAQSADPAPRSNTTGLHLGLYLNGSAMQVENGTTTQSGSGVGVHVGYGVTQKGSIFARVDVANMEEDQFALSHADLGLRLSFGRTGSAFQPFIQGAVGGRRVASEEDDAGLRGIAFTGGAGLEYFVSRTLAVEAGLSLSWGEFSQVRQGGSGWVDLESQGFNATTSRFDIGISWHP